MATWVQEISLTGTPLSGAICAVTLGSNTISAVYSTSKEDVITELVTKALTTFGVPAAVNSLDSTIMDLTLDITQAATVTYTGAASIEYYYDAEYDITFEATIQTTGVILTYLTIKDKITSSYTVDAYTPPTLTSLLTELNTLYDQLTAGTYCGGTGCGCCDEVDYTVWNTATSLYNLIVANGQAGTNEGSYAYVVQMKKIFYCGVYNPTHTNAIIGEYSFGVTNTSLQNVTPHKVSFVVDATGSPMVTGDTVYVLSDVPVQGSLDVFVDGSLLTEGLTIVPSYNTVYTTTSAIISFTQGVQPDQVIEIHYWKAATAVYGSLAIAQTVFTATAPDTTATTVITALVGASIVAITKEIAPLTGSQWSFNNSTGIVTLLGGLTLDTNERLFILYTTS